MRGGMARYASCPDRLAAKITTTDEQNQIRPRSRARSLDLQRLHSIRRRYHRASNGQQTVLLRVCGDSSYMHTCKVPGEALDSWLKQYPSTVDNYGHLLLEQIKANDEALVEAFRPYFESAHLDAREHFHEQIGIDLHPDAEAPGAHAVYPGCLPDTARRGLFGEVMAGMITEHCAFVGGHKWRVPVFLFRYHADVEAYLFDLARDPKRTRAVFGRFGSDFLALALDGAGQVIRFLAGEAKWRQSLTTSVLDTLLLGEIVTDKHGKKSRSGKGIWSQLNLDTPVPHGMRQLQRLLKERDPTGHSAAILSIDRAILLKTAQPIPRTNLVLICGNSPKTREEAYSLIDWQEKPAQYTVPHDLQVVELLLSDGETLIDEIYESLWSGDK